MDTILYILGGSLFLISLGGYFYVKIRLKPKKDSDLDNYYYEFEDRYPAFAKYIKWSRITFTAAVIAALLLFIALVFWNLRAGTAILWLLLFKNYHLIKVKTEKINQGKPILNIKKDWWLTKSSVIIYKVAALLSSRSPTTKYNEATKKRFSTI